MAGRSNTGVWTQRSLARALETTGRALLLVCENIQAAEEKWGRTEKFLGDFSKRIEDSVSLISDAVASRNESAEEIKRQLDECDRIVSVLLKEKDVMARRREWLRDISASCDVLEENLDQVGGLLYERVASPAFTFSGRIPTGQAETRAKGAGLAVSRARKALNTEKTRIADLDKQLTRQIESLDNIERNISEVREQVGLANSTGPEEESLKKAEVETRNVRDRAQALECELKSVKAELEMVRTGALETASDAKTADAKEHDRMHELLQAAKHEKTEILTELACLRSEVEEAKAQAMLHQKTRIAAQMAWNRAQKLESELEWWYTNSSIV